jgi:hypothetical protein
MKKWRMTSKKMEKNEDDIKKNHPFSIPLKFRANLSWD